MHFATIFASTPKSDVSRCNMSSFIYSLVPFLVIMNSSESLVVFSVKTTSEVYKAADTCPSLSF